MGKTVDGNTWTPRRCGSRHGQAILMFFVLVITYALRVNFSVAIVAITSPTPQNPNFPTLKWTGTEQGLILSSFFWGYFFLQIPAGYLARRFGQSRLIAGSLILSSVLTCFVPLAAVYGGWSAVCALRVLMGLTQGFIYPSVNTHLARWAVPNERNRMMSFTFSGVQLGSMVMMLVGGVLAASGGGWPSIFYVSGAASLLMGIMCAIFGADTPNKHRRIDPHERDYINESLIHTTDDSVTMPTPWKDIFRSLPLFAILVAHMCDCWGFWTLLTLMPSYINGVLGFDIQNDGFLSALPYLTMWIANNIFGILADYLIIKNVLTLRVSRKIWNSLAHYGPAVALLILAFVRTDVTSAVALLTVAVTVNSATSMGYLTNHIDLSPNMAGTLMGITNGLSNVTSILGPLVSRSLLTDESDVGQWQIVFSISAGIYIVGNTIFIVCGSADIQSWNYPKANKRKVTVL